MKRTCHFFALLHLVFTGCYLYKAPIQYSESVHVVGGKILNISAITAIGKGTFMPGSTISIIENTNETLYLDSRSIRLSFCCNGLCFQKDVDVSCEQATHESRDTMSTPSVFQVYTAIPFNELCHNTRYREHFLTFEATFYDT